ncbi:hypothetical protein HDV00_001017 [Rhizophlyctis rosea]|nr:hypothetical protein HDV00_001017 [Rhizophlyctis rosea]
MGGIDWSVALEGIKALNKAKRLEDLIGVAFPSLDVTTFYHSLAWQMFEIPAKLPQRVYNRGAKVAILQRANAEWEFMGKLLLRLVTGDLRWEMAILDPREFLLDVYETKWGAYRDQWGILLGFTASKYLQELLSGANRISVGARSRMEGFQFPGTKFDPANLTKGKIAEPRSRKNPIELPNLVKPVGPSSVKGLLIQGSSHEIVDIPVRISKSEIDDTYLDGHLGEDCMGFKLNKDSLPTKGTANFLVFTKAGGTRANPCLKQLTGMDIRTDAAIIAYEAPWRDGRRQFADLPYNWRKLLKQFGRVKGPLLQEYHAQGNNPVLMRPDGTPLPLSSLPFQLLVLNAATAIPYHIVYQRQDNDEPSHFWNP